MARTGKMVVLVKPANVVEAKAVEDLLASEGIDFTARSYDLGVLPGVRGSRTAWGEVRVAAESLDRARELLAALKSAPVDEEELARQALSERRR